MHLIRTLRMIRRLDVPLPDADVPTGYTIRSFIPGEEQRWGDTLDANGDLGPWDGERVRRSFAVTQKKGIGQVWKESIHFALLTLATKPDIPIGTACIQRHGDHPDLPELSWVSVHPAHRLKGIGQALCLTILHFMKSHGYIRCFLRTNTSRLDAVRTFLSIGFTPFKEHPTYDAERWSNVMEALNR